MEDKKIIINIGRQLGSGGHDIAKMLARDFGCKFYDKELLNLAAEESGFSKKFFEQNDEQKGFFKSLFHIHMPFASDTTFYNNKFSQESLFQFQSDAIKKAADEGSCVFVGRCADYVLRDYENTVSVFITADMKDRAMRVSRRHLCDMETAERIIENQESDRSTTTTRARNGDTEPAMTCASTRASWALRRRSCSSRHSSGKDSQWNETHRNHQ